MQSFEYKVVPAPKRSKRVKGLKTAPDRFSHTLTELINIYAAEGWEYMRAETLPMEEKKSMLGAPTESYQSVLVFRRATQPPRAAAARSGPDSVLKDALRDNSERDRMVLGPADRDPV